MMMNMNNKIINIVNRIKIGISTFFTKIILVVNNVSYGSDLKVNGWIKLQIIGNASIGNNVRINSSFNSNPISQANHTSIIIRGGVFQIGNETGISNSCFVCAKGISIGNQVLIGAGCQFYDNDFHPLVSKYCVGDKRDDSYIKSKEIIIEDKVFIGANSIILKGTHIGEGAIIGAGSVVSGYIPPYEIWAGNPARYIKKAQ